MLAHICYGNYPAYLLKKVTKLFKKYNALAISTNHSLSISSTHSGQMPLMEATFSKCK